MPRQQTSDPIQIARATRERMLRAFLLLLFIFGGGALGYWYLGWHHRPGHWSFGECLYMTAITVTTVGYGEVLDLDTVPGGRVWTLVLLVFGISANLYAVSAFTSFFVESDFTNIRRYRRELRRMKEITGHYIVCGVGSTGIHVVEELLATGHAVVAIDERQHLLDKLRERSVLTLTGDATDDEVLEEAGIHRAAGIIAALDDDKTNMFVVVSARQTNPELRIVAKAVSASATVKLRRAGADAVVSPTMIGGMRLASEILRPHVVRFLDDMLRDPDARLRIEEAVVGSNGPMVGKTLQEANLRETVGVLIVAVRSLDGKLDHIPPDDLQLQTGQTLIAIGRPEQVQHLRKQVGH